VSNSKKKGFTSKAQMKKLAGLVKTGEFEQLKFKFMEENTDMKTLPDKAEPKPGGIIRRPRRERK